MHEQAQRAEALQPGVAAESWPAGWRHLTDPETSEACITPFLIQYDPEKMLAVLRANRAGYICVEESGILSRPLAKTEQGGYPRAFVDNLPNLPFIEKVAGDWPGVTLWKVLDEAAGPETPRGPDGMGDSP